MAVPFEMCDFLFQTKYTGITALINAFDRATAQFTWSRVWPRDAFGELRNGAKTKAGALEAEQL